MKCDICSVDFVSTSGKNIEEETFHRLKCELEIRNKNGRSFHFIGHYGCLMSQYGSFINSRSRIHVYKDYNSHTYITVSPAKSD